MSARPLSPAGTDRTFFESLGLNLCRSRYRSGRPRPLFTKPAFHARRAPLKLAGLFLSSARSPGLYMTVKSAEEYRAQARSVRQLAEKFSSPEERQTLLDIAESYKRLAQQADVLANPKIDAQADGPSRPQQRSLNSKRARGLL